MAISAIFTNHWAAVDACNDLGELGLIVDPGRDKKKGRGKKETQLVIDIPQDLGGREEQLLAMAEAIITKYEGCIVH
jgi:hypothetical protein